MKKLSIIVPMYNVASYIETCIDSIYKQNIPLHDFEVILIDDESPDNSLEIAKALVRTKDNVKIISQKNKGLGGARNTGIENASGVYILFLDADDYYIDNTINHLIVLAEKYTLDILEFGAEGINRKGEITYSLAINNEPQVSCGIQYFNNVKYMLSACNKLYKLNFFSDNNLRFSEKIYGEDFEFNTRAFFFANRVMATNHIVARFFESEGSITRSKDVAKKRKYINDLVTSLRKINDFRLKNSHQKREEAELFFKEIMAFTTLLIFYKILFSDFSLAEALRLKNTLMQEGIYEVKFRVYDRKKELFRKWVLGFDLTVYKLLFGVKTLLSRMK